MSRSIPAPILNETSREFWEAARGERLLIGDCATCGAAHYHPRSLCPHCHSADVSPREAAGVGEIYSFSVMRRTQSPFAIAYVTLDEGVSMMTNLVDCDLDALAVGQRVRVQFVETREDPDGEVWKAPCFTPL
jgi:uncharacterized OB-fold protein